MSTEIGQIDSPKGHSSIYVTRFFGGKDRGCMIQVTIRRPTGEKHMQITMDKAQELGQMLLDSDDRDKYPSE